MTETSVVPLPLDPPPLPEADDRRLWIGNLDSRLTEYNLIKLLQQYGKVKKFDFLFHKSGPFRGQPRGYCFVTYETRDQAKTALLALSGKLILKKNIIVKWAHSVPVGEGNLKKNTLDKPEMLVEKSAVFSSVNGQITAIEEKLRAMNEQTDMELELSHASVSQSEVSSEIRNFNSLIYRKVRNGPYHKNGQKLFYGKRR